MSFSPARISEPIDLKVITEHRVTTVVSIRGSAGLNAGAELDREIDEILFSDPMAVVLDLSGLRFITSLGVRSLLRLYLDVSARGGCVCIAGVTGYVADVLTMVKLDRFMPMFPTVEAALEMPFQRASRPETGSAAGAGSASGSPAPRRVPRVQPLSSTVCE